MQNNGASRNKVMGSQNVQAVINNKLADCLNKLTINKSMSAKHSHSMFILSRGDMVRHEVGVCILVPCAGLEFDPKPGPQLAVRVQARPRPAIIFQARPGPGPQTRI